MAFDLLHVDGSFLGQDVHDYLLNRLCSPLARACSGVVGASDGTLGVGMYYHVSILALVVPGKGGLNASYIGVRCSLLSTHGFGAFSDYWSFSNIIHFDYPT
jgi:hypothetical protein